MSDSDARERVKTLFLSDIHLGTRGCQAEQLLDLLKHYDAETIFLVGDIIDGWRLKSAWHWPPLHNVVVQKLLRKVRKGTRIVYIPGNHDEFLRDYVGENFGGIDIVEEATYRLIDGRKALILHGDKFDTVVRNVKWLAHLGDWAYEFAMWINRHLNSVRRMLGMPYWSFSAASKAKVKQAVSFIGAFEVPSSPTPGTRVRKWSFVATSTMPPSVRWGRCCMSIAATGWNRAPRSPSILMAVWS